VTLVAGAVVVVIERKLELQLPVQSVPITTKVVSSNPVQGEVYLIQYYMIKFVSELNIINQTNCRWILLYIIVDYWRLPWTNIVCYIYLNMLIFLIWPLQLQVHCNFDNITVTDYVERRRICLNYLTFINA